MNDIVEAVLQGKLKEIVDIVQAVLDGGADPDAVLADGLVNAMDVVAMMLESVGYEVINLGVGQEADFYAVDAAHCIDQLNSI